MVEIGSELKMDGQATLCLAREILIAMNKMKIGTTNNPSPSLVLIAELIFLESVTGGPTACLRVVNVYILEAWIRLD